MNTIQQTLDLPLRTKIRLSEIERLIRKHRIIVPPLSRRALVAMCEDGTFETAKRTSPGQCWLVYEDSFLDWLRRMDAE